MNLAYRPEVDGLRSIAVLLVILHHLGWNAISGGYVGVDVFFVISGYLITSIIFAEIRDGKFSIANFYKRRIIRLAPAYFLVLGVTSIASLVFMLPAELLNYAASVLYSTFFAANFYMWKEVGGYFGAQSEYVPLLHLWSLAVEEQFYIFWPLILIWLTALSRRAVLPLVLVAVLGGAVLSEWGVRNYLAASYYLLPTRFFELMIGALVAIGPRLMNRLVVARELFSLLGLAFIGYAGLVFTTARLFPGYSALVPCIGAAMVIYFAQSGQGLAGRALSTRLMVYIGKISYPAYLWHWPIIAFLNLNRITIDWLVGLIVLMTTLILSALTHRYVERPFRLRISGHRLLQVVGYGFVAPTVCAATFVFATNNLSGLPARFSDQVNLKNAALLSFTYKARGRCNEGNVKSPLGEDDCVLGVKDRPVDFLLVGDSHANHFTAMLDYMAKGAGVRGYDITQSQTIYLPEVKRFYLQDDKKVEHINFELRNEKLTQMIAENRYKAVIMGGSFASYYNGEELQRDGASSSAAAFENGLRAALINITKSDSIPIIVKGNPKLKGVSQDCGLNNLRFKHNAQCDFDVAKHQQNFSKWNELLRELQFEFPKLIVISPDEIICDETVCHSELNGVPLYRDYGNLNQIGSELVGKLYVEKFGNPIAALRSNSNTSQ